jgi:hypothetical protein
MNIVINLLWSFLGTETFKVLLKKGVRKIVETKGVSIDKELAESLILDISESNGNNLTKDIAINIVKEL